MIDFLKFFNNHFIGNHQKSGDRSLKKQFNQVSPTRPKKNWERGSFSLTRYCILREKKQNSFWFSSLGQMVQFDNIKVRRTFTKFIGQFLLIENRPV